MPTADAPDKTDVLEGVPKRRRLSSKVPPPPGLELPGGDEARDAVVKEDDLYESLKNKKILGAAIDVFQNEPYIGPLTNLENVILTAHIGSYSKEAKLKMEIDAVQNLIDNI